MPKFYVVAGQYHNNGVCQGKKNLLESSSILKEHHFMVRVFTIIIANLLLFELQPRRVWWEEPRQSTQ